MIQAHLLSKEPGHSLGYMLFLFLHNGSLLLSVHESVMLARSIGPI